MTESFVSDMEKCDPLSNHPIIILAAQLIDVRPLISPKFAVSVITNNIIFCHQNNRLFDPFCDTIR